MQLADELYINAKNGDEDAIDVIYKEIKDLLHYLSLKYSKNNPIEADDAFSYCCIGFMKAIQSYNLEKKIHFSTYLCKCCFNEVFASLRKFHSVEYLDGLIYYNKEDQEVTLENIITSTHPHLFNVSFTHNIDYVLLRECVEYTLNKYSGNKKSILEYWLNNGGGQMHIADTFNMSQAYVSRTMTSFKKALNAKLLKEGIINKNIFTDIKQTQKVMGIIKEKNIILREVNAVTMNGKKLARILEGARNGESTTAIAKELDINVNTCNYHYYKERRRLKNEQVESEVITTKIPKTSITCDTPSNVPSNKNTFDILADTLKKRIPEDCLEQQSMENCPEPHDIDEDNKRRQALEEANLRSVDALPSIRPSIDFGKGELRISGNIQEENVLSQIEGLLKVAADKNALFSFSIFW